MSWNGPLYEIRFEDYEATIAASGATLVSLRHAGRALTVAFDPRTEIGEGWVLVELLLSVAACQLLLD